MAFPATFSTPEVEQAASTRFPVLSEKYNTTKKPDVFKVDWSSNKNMQLCISVILLELFVFSTELISPFGKLFGQQRSIYLLFSSPGSMRIYMP